MNTFFANVTAIIKAQSRPRTLYLLIEIIVLATVFFAALRSISDFDTGYHLQTGKYILETRSVPLHDIFSFSASGARWITHYWLSDVLFYLTYSGFGIAGLRVFVAMIAV